MNYLNILILLLILVLIYKIFYPLHESYSNISNSEFKIVMFLTSGLCEEAENCIITLRKLNLCDKLIVHTLDEKAYYFMSKLGVNVVNKKTNLKPEADFGTKDFYEIMYSKLEIIDECLQKYKCTILYTDTDIVFLKDISSDIIKFNRSNYDIIFQNDTGGFNDKDKHMMCAGFFAVKYNNKGLNCLKYAKKLMKDNWDNRKWDNGGGADQKAMNLAISKNKLKVGTFDLMDYANGSRYFKHHNKFKNYTPKMIHNNYIVGTKNKVKRFKKYNLWFVNKVEPFTNINKKLDIYMPVNQKGIFNHNNDTFRELVDIWKQRGYVNVINTKNNHVWAKGIGKVLLYDRPTLEYLNTDSYELGLFGNPDLPKNNKNNKHWIFWARNPKLLLNSYNNNRIYNVIYIGKIENNVQNKYRNNNWSKYVDKFDLITGKVNKYSPEEYLNQLSKSKFGLCLRGFGPKCNREIELLALGVVLLVTPDVSLKYYNQLNEGQHYFKINKPEDIPSIVNNCNQQQWEYMSQSCKKWYDDNCSPEGAFKVTMDIIEKNSI